jgi:hypothetical protein
MDTMVVSVNLEKTDCRVNETGCISTGEPNEVSWVGWMDVNHEKTEKSLAEISTVNIRNKKISLPSCLMQNERMK